MSEISRSGADRGSIPSGFCVLNYLFPVNVWRLLASPSLSGRGVVLPVPQLPVVRKGRVNEEVSKSNAFRVAWMLNQPEIDSGVVYFDLRAADCIITTVKDATVVTVPGEEVWTVLGIMRAYEVLNEHSTSMRGGRGAVEAVIRKLKNKNRFANEKTFNFEVCGKAHAIAVNGAPVNRFMRVRFSVASTSQALAAIAIAYHITGKLCVAPVMPALNDILVDRVDFLGAPPSYPISNTLSEFSDLSFSFSKGDSPVFSLDDAIYRRVPRDGSNPAGEGEIVFAVVSARRDEWTMEMMTGELRSFGVSDFRSQGHALLNFITLQYPGYREFFATRLPAEAFHPSTYVPSLIGMHEKIRVLEDDGFREAYALFAKLLDVCFRKTIPVYALCVPHTHDAYIDVFALRQVFDLYLYGPSHGPIALGVHPTWSAVSPVLSLLRASASTADPTGFEEEIKRARCLNDQTLMALIMNIATPGPGADPARRVIERLWMMLVETVGLAWSPVLDQQRAIRIVRGERPGHQFFYFPRSGTVGPLTSLSSTAMVACTEPTNTRMLVFCERELGCVLLKEVVIAKTFDASEESIDFV